MKNGFYAKIAFSNLKKSYRFFIPKILSEAGLLGSFYIILTLAMDERLSKVKGGDYIPTFMWMGAVIIGLLSSILMFYTNSFLMKQRKREFGLYNILGMEKRHVGRVLFHETVQSGLLAILPGLLLGVLFYKLCSLAVCGLLHADVIVGFYFITPMTLIPAALLFVLLDLITCLINRIHIARMKPVELLASIAVGEKEPRVKWVLLILGLLCLGSGYYISITTESPLAAIILFFVAVLLVIFGTYFLFVSGSIFVLKLLKKNEKYYYHRKHMPAVSGLMYRMKQNAVGLASISILATGVLVMISTTVSLYAGMDVSLNALYPQQMYINQNYTVFPEIDSETQEHGLFPEELLTGLLEEACEENGAKVATSGIQHYLDVYYLLRNDGELSADLDAEDASLSRVAGFLFMTEKTYRELGGEELDLQKDQAVLCNISLATAYPADRILVAGLDLQITGTLSFFPVKTPMMSDVPSYGVVLSDDEVLDTIYEAQCKDYGDKASSYTDRLAVTFTDEEKAEMVYDRIELRIQSGISDWCDENLTGVQVGYGGIESVWRSRASVRGMYGTLLFLGILLGFVCLFATALIIYYKQISEGYEDRSRFQIMEKIGMSSSEVRKTINEQIILVFFLPLLVAGIHLVFAFPILDKLLHMMLLSSTSLYILCAVIVYLVFALIYTLIYTGTARTYYKIVH